MRIAILVNLFPPRWLAGTEIATQYLATHLAQRGHEVHVFTSLDEGLQESNYENGIFNHRLPKGTIRFVGYFTFWIHIVRAIPKVRPDIIHVQSLSIGIPALILKKICKIPYVVWGQGSDVYLPDWFMKITSRAIIKNADSVIALTGDMKRAMKVIYDRDILVVPNGIDLGEYGGEPKEKKREGLEKRILFVGRLHPVKGIQYLLKAMQTVHMEMPDARLILVGDGEERGHLENMRDRLGIRECVEFTGRVPHGTIKDYMNQADIFVLSSLSEGFPVTILEAMACNLPIIATRVGGLPDIIEEGVNGYIVEAKQPDEISDKLLMLLRDDTVGQFIAANNREKVKMFAWDKIAKILEDVYHSTVALNVRH